MAKAETETQINTEEQVKETVKIMVADAEEFVIALDGILGFEKGSILFKRKVAGLLREIRAKLKEKTEAVDIKQEKLIRKIKLGQAAAQAQQKAYFITTDVAADEEAFLDDSRKVKKDILKLASPLILDMELPTAEEIAEEKIFDYTYQAPDGNTRYKRYSPNTLIGIISGVLTTSTNGN